MRAFAFGAHMPTARLKPCRMRGCSALGVQSGYCLAHRPSAKPVMTAEARARKRLYDTAHWKRVRQAKLFQQPLCEECLKRDELVAADHVDHIVAVADGGSFDDEANLRSLCRSCHSSKTARQDGGFGNRRRGAEGG